MNKERYQRMTEIFHEAADLEGKKRESFLDEACKGDQELRCEVELLLNHDDPEDDALLDKRPEIGCELLSGMSAFGSGVIEGYMPQLSHLEQIGPYRIIEQIGEGGMGLVFLAEQDHPRRRVAIKMIRPGLLSPGLLKRFRFEADVQGRLKHQGIAQIYDANEIQTDAGPLPYLVMEYVEGDQLKSYVKKHHCNVREQLELVARISEAVHHAHQNGIVHRDLKPENVIVIKSAEKTEAGIAREFARLGQPKILDFGVARATDSDVQVTTMQTDVGQLIGTLTYMSPEQVEGDSSKLDERSDIYALGVILYELLAGRPPLDLKEKSIPEAGRMIREEEPTRLGSLKTDFRGDIDTIAYKALEKDRERRYSSALTLATDIRRHLANKPIFAHPPSTLYQFKKFAKRNKGLMAGLVLSFLVLLAGIVFSLSFALRAIKGEAEAKRAAYRFSITAADAISDTNPYRALKHLEKIPAEFRSWEWRHLFARINAHVSEWKGECSGVVFRSDGRLVLPQVRDGAIELKEIPTGDLLAVFRAPEKLSHPVLSPLGARLATLAEAEKKLIIWDTETKMRLKVIPVPAPDIKKIRLSPSGSYITYVSTSTGLNVIETATGKQVLQAPLDSALSNLTFDPTEARFAMATQSRLYLYTVTGERLLKRNTWSMETQIAYSPDGTRLALGEHNRLVRILDASTFEQIDALYGHSDDVTALSFFPDGRRLASISIDGSVLLWNIETARAERAYIGFSRGVRPRTLLLSTDGKTMAATHFGGIRIFALEQEARRLLKGHLRYVYHVTFSPDGRLLASSGFNEKARLWNGVTGEPLAEFKTHNPHRSFSFTPDGSRLLVSNMGSLSFWDPVAGLPVTEARTEMDGLSFDSYLDYFSIAADGAKMSPDAGERIVLSPDRTLLAVGTHSKTYGPASRELAPGSEEILIKDPATDRIIRRIGKFDCGVLSVAFSPDGAKLASGLKSGFIYIWNFATGEELALMKGHTSAVYSIDYSPDGTRIVTGGNDGMIILWDAETYEQVLVLSGHTSYVHSVCFSPDGTLIASGSGDGTVRMWDSVPPADRWRDLQKDKDMQGEACALLDRLLKKLGDPLDVADYLRADDSISDDLRRVACLELLKRSSAEATGKK